MMDPQQLQGYREQLKCSFPQLEDVFADCMLEAKTLLTEKQISQYLESASLVGSIGQGFDPVLSFLEEMPQVVKRLDERAIKMVSDAVWRFSRTPNGKAIAPFLNTIGEAARRLDSSEHLACYIEMLEDMADRTSVSIHGIHKTIPSEGVIPMLNNIVYLLNQLSLTGIHNWIEYGVRNYPEHPERQADYFSLQSADSTVILQRERHGTLFIDSERGLNFYLRALWNNESYMRPYPTLKQTGEPITPYFDEYNIRLPDVLDDCRSITDGSKVTGLNRYRALLAHMMAHQNWTKEIMADNYSPQQRMAISIFEDSRVECLAIRRFPGLKKLFLSLHSKPIENECQPEIESCAINRMTMLSYALLNSEHDYQNPDILEFVDRFHQLMKNGESATQEMATLGCEFVARTRRQSDQLPNVFFKDTYVDYRDDNRCMWYFIEELDGDVEEYVPENRNQDDDSELDALPPRHYPEWDYISKSYRPDWASVYEALHPNGEAGKIDKLLEKHQRLIKQLKQLLDLLKPQQYVRIRYQEEGSELDLDTAIRSLIDFKSGSMPDPRINMSHKHDGRDIAVMLLLDLSESLNQVPEGCTQTLLELSQEAVSLLAYAIEHLGDKFSIAGFSSNTRHEVRYQHIKGYSEHWGDPVKSRIAGMQAGYSTRMGAAMRHAAHYLSAQKAEKKLMLVLTDGEPADIDTPDERVLIEDSRKAVQELHNEGIYSFCINLDKNADDYVQDVFSNNYLVIDKVADLPVKLPKLFMSLTG